MLKRKLLRHVLPILLSVSMVFGSIPATARAAEYTESETVEAAETEAAVQSETEAAKQSETEVTKQTETKEAAQTETEAADAAEVNADAPRAALDTKIIIEEDFLEEYANQDYLQYDVDEKVVTAKYDETESNVFGSLRSEMEDWNINGAISIRVDGEDTDVPEENLSFQWKKKSGDGYVEMPGEVPTAPGSYQLVVSLNAIDGVCQAATAELDFTITKRQLSFKLDDVISVAPGTTVDKFLTNLKKNYILQKEDRNWEDQTTELPETAKDIYIASFEAEVHDAHDTENTALSGETVLVESGDYTVTVKASLKEAVALAYELAEKSAVNIKIENLIETKVRVEQKDAGELISKVYAEDTPVSYETDIKNKINLSIVVPDESGDTAKDVVIEGAQPTLVWCDADKNELGPDPDEAPTDAGTYYLDFQFIPSEEQQEIYKESKENYIKVVIEPQPLTLTISEMEGEYYSGMTEATVLQDVEYTLVNGAGEEFDFDPALFWGVSYDQPDYTQAYKPVFKLIRAEKEKDGTIKKDADGKEIWEDNQNWRYLDASKYAYRIQFTGKKAIYKADGTKADERDVNGGEVNTADTNYCIETSKKTLFDKSVAVNVKDGIATKIDVSAIVEAGVNTTKDFNDLYKPTHFSSKIYDGSKLYENRGAYKKAQVTTADGEPVASDYDDTLTYEWYRIDVAAKKPAYDEETGKQTGWDEYLSTKLKDNAIPTAAGDYKLVVRFSDIENGYDDSNETLYYRIDRQLLVVSPTSIPTARMGETVSDYIDRLSYEEEHNIYIVPGNQYNSGFKTEENLLTGWKQMESKYWQYDTNTDCYELNWYVERQERNDDKTPKKDENGNIIYRRLSSGDGFKIPDENYYRLGVELTCANSNYTNYEVLYHADIEKQDFAEEHLFHNDYADITVKEVGSTELKIEIDETKLASTVKDYDAKPFYATKEEAYADVLKAVTVRKKADDSVLDSQPVLSYSIYDETLGDYIYDFEDMVYAGTYRLELGFEGDETYAPCVADKDIEYTIKPLELEAAPYVYDNIAAGTYVYADSEENDGIIYNSTMASFVCANMPEEDKPAFEWRSNLHTYLDDDGEKKTVYYNGYAAYFESDGLSGWNYNALSATVRKAGKSEEYDGYIRYNTSYTVQLSGNLAYPYSRNYNIKYTKTPFKAAFRGPSAVYGTDGEAVISCQWNQEEIATTVTPVKGIPYQKYTKLTDIDGSEFELEGNCLTLRIAAPEEFQEDTGSYDAYFDDFVYKNSIKKDAGGYVTGTDPANGMITVIIPADEKVVKSFEIIWENGYTETFSIDFTNAVFLDDLTKAVAPKSVAFNGVNKKMAVGDEQQLDVTIKKVQISDIIYLDYRVLDGKDVISVTCDDEKKTAGYVTALKVGTATVAAVPVRLENGKKTDIPDAKAATVKITVSDVAAPAIKKITAIDNQAVVEYTKPANGYRREVYVLEGAKKTEADFKNAILSMNNGSWKGIFAVEPVYYTGAMENARITDVKKQLLSINVTKLKAGTDYTVYIRNVSGVRTLYDGAVVTESAKGSVKGFKTTLPQVKGLKAYFKQTVESSETETETATEREVTNKKILLTQKTEQLYASGKFQEKPEYEPADDVDYLWFDLPLDKKQHKGYVVPKLTYWLSVDDDTVPVEEVRDFKNYTYVSGKDYKKAEIAAIDKSGKITLKGIGTVCANVRDIATGVSSKAYLEIGANADSVAGKGGKLAVGQGIYLSSLLTYTVNKTVIVGYDKQDLSIADESLRALNDAGNFSIVPTGDGDYFVTALKPKASCEITVTDNLVALLGGASSVTLKLQSAPIEAVKTMKITDVVDNGFVINFAYTVQADNETWYTGERMLYRIVITDARKSVVDSVVVDSRTFDSVFYRDIKSFNADITSKSSYYDGKKKMFSYRYPYYNKKLARLSSYNVSVTPIYGSDFSAKPTAKSVSTTNFPASYVNLVNDGFGGETVYAIGYAGTTKKETELRTTDLARRPYLTSGNTYTLKLDDKGTTVQISKDRMTDSLTWKSTDAKVAKVTANTGTYTATLSAVKAGITVIEVTSKITKKVIARYPVFVKAAGNAKDDYYGDYEYTGEYPYQLDPFYNSSIEVLTEANPVYVDDYDLADVTAYDTINRKTWRAQNYRWVKFTAPKFGEYTFTVSGTVKQIVDGSGAEYGTKQRKFTIFEGQTLYFNMEGIFRMTVEGTKMSGVLTTTDGIDISGDRQYVQFRAAEDNYYTFYTKDGAADGINRIGRLNEETQSFETVSGVVSRPDEDGTVKKSVGLYAGDVIYLEMKDQECRLYAEKRAVETLSVNAAKPLSIKADGEQWYTFTASAAGDYTFQSAEASAVINMDYYQDITAASGTANIGSHYGADGKDVTYTIPLKEKQKAAFRVYADADKITDAEAAVTASVSVSAEVPDVIEVNGTKELGIPQDSAKWVSVKFTEAGRYTFHAVPVETDASYDITLKYYKNGMDKSFSVTEDEVVVSDRYTADAKAGDTIFVKVETSKRGAETPETANVRISLTKTTAAALTAGAAAPLTVENGGKYWYTFVAPSYGTYVFRSVVTEITPDTTHYLSARKYDSMEKKQFTESLNTTGYDFHKNYTLETGEEVVLKVYPSVERYAEDGTTPVTTAAQIRVDKLEAAAFTMENPANGSLQKGDVAWYSFTAPRDADYTFTKSMTAGSAAVEMYSALNDASGRIDTLSDSTEYTLTEGKTVYFKAKQNGEEEAVFTITASAPVIEPLPDAPADVASGSIKYYECTVSEPGRYFISYTASPAEADVTVRYGFGSVRNAANPVNNGCEEVDFVPAGTKVYFKVSTAGETAVSVGIKVEQVVPTELAAGTEVPATVQPDRSAWYSFTAAEPGRYAFFKTDAENNSTNVRYYKNLTDTSSMAGGAPDGNYFKQGDEVYIRLSTTQGEQQTANLKVEKITPTPITAEPMTVTVSPGEKRYYIFTADKQATYQFHAAKTVQTETGETSEMIPGVSVHRYANIENTRMAYAWDSVVRIKGTESVTFVFGLPSGAAEAETFTLSWTDADAGMEWIERVNQPVDVTLSSGERKQFGFEAPEDGLFAFSTAGVTDTRITPVIYKENDKMDEGFYYMVYLEAGETARCFVGYEYNTDSDESGAEVTAPSGVTFQVKVSRATPEAIPADTPTDVTVARYEKKIFVFTAPETGRYTVQTSNADFAGELMEYSASGTLLEESGEPVKLPLWDKFMQEKEEFIFGVYYREGQNASESFQVTVETVEPEVTEGTIKAELEPGETRWYEYTVPTTGVYHYTNEDCTYEIYKSPGAESSIATKSGTVRYTSRMAGDKVYIRVVNDTSVKQTAKAAVSLGEEPTPITALDEEFPLDFSNGLKIRWAAFTAEEDGFYNFDVSVGDEYVNIAYATKLSGSSRENALDTAFSTNPTYVPRNKVHSIKDKLIAKGDTAYIAIYALPGSSVVPEGIVVTAHKDTEKTVKVEKLEMGRSEKYIEKGSENAVYYAFYVPEPGNYKISFIPEESDSSADYWVKFYSNAAKEINDTIGIVENFFVTAGKEETIPKPDKAESINLNHICYFNILKQQGASGKALTITITKE